MGVGLIHIPDDTFHAVFAVCVAYADCIFDISTQLFSLDAISQENLELEISTSPVVAMSVTPAELEGYLNHVDLYVYEDGSDIRHLDTTGTFETDIQYLGIYKGPIADFDESRWLREAIASYQTFARTHNHEQVIGTIRHGSALRFS